MFFFTSYQIRFFKLFPNSKIGKRNEFWLKKKRKKKRVGKWPSQAAGHQAISHARPRPKRPGPRRVFFSSFLDMWVPAPHQLVFKPGMKRRTAAHTLTYRQFLAFYSRFDYR
jgi:hypothetical protein